MRQILVAADMAATDTLVRTAPFSGPDVNSTGGNLGPFGAQITARGAFVEIGSLDLIPPNIVQFVKWKVHYDLEAVLTIDLNRILPEFCLPQVCVDLPFLGEVCTPRVCVSWPTISFPVSASSPGAEFTAKFEINVRREVDGRWAIDLVFKDLQQFELNGDAKILIAAILFVLHIALAAVPFIGPLLAFAIDLIAATLGIAIVARRLDLLIRPILRGRRFTIYRQPRTLQLLAENPPLDPAVTVQLTDLGADVHVSGATKLLRLAAEVTAA
jgi:hypothetical protein